LTAEALGKTFAGTASQLGVDTNNNSIRLVGSDGQERTRSLPSLVMIEPGLTLREFTIDGWLRGMSKEVEVMSWPESVVAESVEFEEMAGGAAVEGEKPPQPLLPREASRVLLQTAGIETGSPAVHSTAANVQTPAIVDSA